MNRSVLKCISKLGLTLLVLLIPATPALAEEAPSASPTLNLSVLGAVRTGEPVQFSGSSAYTSAEQLYLTVFVAPPKNNVCPVSATLPAGGDSIVSKEPVDNFLSITDLSDNLQSPGQWTLCGYLSNSSSATIASASVPFKVSGPNKAKQSPKGHQSRAKGKHAHADKRGKN